MSDYREQIERQRAEVRGLIERVHGIGDPAVRSLSESVLRNSLVNLSIIESLADLMQKTDGLHRNVKMIAKFIADGDDTHQRRALFLEEQLIKLMDAAGEVIIDREKGVDAGIDELARVMREIAEER